MVVALASALTGRPVRRSMAMSGEMTLRGEVLAVGGIKQKVLAARRAGLDTVLLPRRNRRDLDPLPAGLRRDLRIRLLADASEALDLALK
jgi:ATP-dependent Lon protease